MIGLLLVLVGRYSKFGSADSAYKKKIMSWNRVTSIGSCHEEPVTLHQKKEPVTWNVSYMF